MWRIARCRSLPTVAAPVPNPTTGRRVTALTLAVVALAACSPFLSKQERTRRAVIGAWVDPDDPTASFVLTDGGAFSLLGSDDPESGTWSTSETGGVAITVSAPLGGAVTMSGVLQGDKFQVTLPSGQASQLVRDSDLAKQTPPLTDQLISNTLLHSDGQKCDTPYAAQVGGLFNTMPAEGARVQFYHWLNDTLSHYQFVSEGESPGGKTRQYLQTGSNGVTSTITTRYYLSVVGETLDDLDHEGPNFVQVSYCKFLPKDVKIIERKPITARRTVITYVEDAQGSPFLNDLLRSEYGLLPTPLDVAKPGKKSGNFVYADGHWQLK